MRTVKNKETVTMYLQVISVFTLQKDPDGPSYSSEHVNLSACVLVF